MSIVTPELAVLTVSTFFYSISHYYSAVLVAVGSHKPDHQKSEKLEGGSWSDIQEPPVGGSFHHYAVVFHAGSFYYFGGYGIAGGHSLSSILCLNAASWIWSNVGQLNSGRHGHGVILAADTFIVIGGMAHDGTATFTKAHEACLLKAGKFSCTESSSALTNYRHLESLFLVSDDYDSC